MIYNNLSRSITSILLLSTASTCVFADDQSAIEQLRKELHDLKEMVNQQQVAQHAQQSSGIQIGSNTEIKFSGNVRLDSMYQIQGSAANRLYNNINKVPLEGAVQSRDRLKSTLSASRFGWDIQHKGQSDQVIKGKLEADFLGGADLDNLRIRHAYVQYGRWLVGQTWSNFAIPDYMPETIDALGYVGHSVKRNPQVRYHYPMSSESSLDLAFEDPKDATSQQRTPAFTARLNHQLNADAKLSLRGMVDEKHTQQDAATAWGLGLGLQYKALDRHTIKLDAYHVKGDSSFVSWTNPGFSRDANQQILDQNEFDSITLGVTSTWHPQWRTTLGFGYMDADVSDTYLKGSVTASEINTSQWQTWANVFYNPTKPLSLGAEYVYGERKAAVDTSDGTGNIGKDNRLNLVAIYQF